MVRALDIYDEARRVAGADDGKVTAIEQETAATRVQAMQNALRKDRELVGAFLNEAIAELAQDKSRTQSTWLVLAALAARTHQLDLAEKLFRPCLRNPPRDNEAYVYTGLVGVLMAQRKYDDVVAICQSALTGSRPRNVRVSFLESCLAEALARKGDFEQALIHADRAIKGTNDDDEVDLRCEKATILAQAERFDEAVSECEQTLQKFTRLKNVLQVRQTLGIVYSLKGDHPKSEEQLRLILEVDPDQARAHNDLGYQMADRNVHLDEAERLIRRAIDLDRADRKVADEEGDNGAYLDSLGWVLFRMGKPAEAREWLEKAAALPDVADDPTVWDHLGDVYSKLDQPAKAKEAWQKAVKLYDTAGRKKTDPKKTEVEKKLKTLD